MTTLTRSAVLTCAALALIGIRHAGARGSSLLGIRTGDQGGAARVVFDLQIDPAACSLERVPGSDDWTVVVPDGCSGSPPARLERPHPLLYSVDPACDGARLRVLLRLSRSADPRILHLAAGNGRPARFVVDLHPGTARGDAVESPAPKAVVSEPQPRRKGNWRIMLDPGHGGHDGGASARGIAEKEVVLDVARRTAKILNATSGFEARITRTDDRFLGLRRRRQIAEEHDADAFLSIHANAARRSQAVGVEVFFLSVGAASDEASRELARLENQADPDYEPEEDSLLRGIPFGFDLRQNDTVRRSSRLAEAVLLTLESSRLAASRGVKQAGFAVLKSFKIPSVLVEVGFISNPSEAERLKTDAHRQRLAEAIAQGTISYFRNYAHARGGDAGPGE